MSSRAHPLLHVQSSPTAAHYGAPSLPKPVYQGNYSDITGTPSAIFGFVSAVMPVGPADLSLTLDGMVPENWLFHNDNTVSAVRAESCKSIRFVGEAVI